MKRFIIGVIVALLLVGCGSVQSSSPPKLTLEINGKVYHTEQSTYCWANRCVDMISPEEIMAGKGTIKVAPNEEIKLVMNYKPNRVEATLSNFKDSGPTEVPMKDLKFHSPSEPGIYYYAASFWWISNQPNTSEGDSSYVFAIEVE